MKLKNVKEKKEVKYPTLKTFCKIGTGVAIAAGVGSFLMTETSSAGKMVETGRAMAVITKIYAIEIGCRMFKSKYNRYPETLNELRKLEEFELDNKTINFYDGATDDDWTYIDDDYLNIFIDSDLDGTADKLMTGKEVGTLSPKDAGIVVKEHTPVFVYTNKNKLEIGRNQILSIMEY